MELFWDSADPMIQRSEWLYIITQTDKIIQKCANLICYSLILSATKIYTLWGMHETTKSKVKTK